MLRAGREKTAQPSESAELLKPALEVSQMKIVLDRKRLSRLSEQEREALTHEVLSLIREAGKTRVHMDAPATASATESATEGVTEG